MASISHHIPRPPKSESTPTSRTVIVILLLIVFYPVGVLCMWFWTKWLLPVKIALTVLGTIFMLPVLLAITLIFLNPARQFEQANNMKRESDVHAIQQAIMQYRIDNNGQLPSGISEVSQTINSAGFQTLCMQLVPTYIAALPTDPLTGADPIQFTQCTTSPWDTNYTVQVDSSGKIVVSAPNAELGNAISSQGN